MLRRSLVSAGIVVCVIALAFALVQMLHPSHRFPAFTQANMAAWHSFGGKWTLRDGIFTDHADGRGDKLIAGPTNHGDYAVSTDVRFDSAAEDTTFGDAGLVLRVTDPGEGVDTFRGYYAALRLDDHVLLIGTMDFDFAEVATIPFPHELHVGRWYHLTFTARGCNFDVRAEDTVTKEHAEVSYVEQVCHPLRGQAGIRSYYARASWRNFQVKLLR